MNMRIILLAVLAIVLTACRGNLTERDTDPQTSRSEDRPAVAENQSMRSDDNAVTPPPPATGGSYLAGDGPGADTPANLNNIPDAVPRAEP